MNALIPLMLVLVASPALGWDSPAQLSGAAPQRVINIPTGQDPARWARHHGLSDWQLGQNSQGQQHLTSRMNDRDWQAFKQQCGAACVTDSCQGVRTLQLLPGQQGWLVPKAPDLARTLRGQADACPDNLQSQPWNGQWPAGSDLSCWQLQVNEPCQSEQTPAQYLKEQWRANQLLLTIPAGGESALDLATRMGMQLLDDTPLKSTGDRLVLLQRPDGAAPLGNLLSQLGRDPAVSLVQRDLAYFTLADKGDPLAAFNYGPKVSASAQLMPTYSGKSVEVAVIDTGVDSSHPELADRLKQQRDFSGKGYSADAHGTAVATIIAGAQGNGIGASGVAPDVQIHSLKACHPKVPGALEARCWSSSLIKALDTAIDQRIPIINLSLGGPPSPILKKLVQAAERHGLLVVSAAGNGGPNARPVYPAAWPEALAVTAIDPNKQLYRMANRGRYVQLAAPGVDIITAGPKGAQPVLSGTSMATAHISGIAAQLKQIDPSADGAHITALMVLSSEDLGDPGPDEQYGSGLVNACRSAMGLKNLKSICADQLRSGGQ